jgi:glycosyltransferase involved in cell wall biosynthesis
VRSPNDTPRALEFLWFNGSGAVHKGLDIALEVFAQRPHLTLHCVGPYLSELDFVRAYRHELFSRPNIHSHGYVLPSDPRFVSIASRCAAFVSPSCSEGTSTSVLTCLLFGMVPLISAQTGVDAPAGSGRVLADLSPEAWGVAVDALAEAPGSELSAMIEQGQSWAREQHSRAAFTHSMACALGQLLRSAS